MSTILFDSFPASGHYNAILKTAKILNNNNLHVVITGSAEFKERVERQGLEYFVTTPFLMTPETMLKKQGRGRSLFQSRSAYNSKRKEEWNENFTRWKDAVLAVKPSLVVLDEHYAIKAGAYMLLGIPVMLFQTMPDTLKIKGNPPFTDYFIPRFSALSNLICKGLWLVKEFNPYYGHLGRKLKLLRIDDLSVQLEIYNSKGIDLSGRIDLKRSFGIGIKGLSMLIVSPAPFDFPHEEQPNVFRVGPLVDICREGKIDLPRYQTLLNQIEKQKNGQKGMVVYSSMGTISGNDVKRCTRFFLHLAKVARMNPGDLFILSTGSYFDINLLLPLPSNMMVFETVPQVDLLQKCDIMITHGGMNSITECVFCGVPMLVYPLSRQWDQPGNSARVAYHGLGLRGRIERGSAKTMSRKLNLIKTNYSFYKSNVLKMRELFEVKNYSTEIVTIIESIINSHER
jgi:zeaxanthin glucosyltransferase